MSDWRDEYERRTRGKRNPEDIYRDMKAAASTGYRGEVGVADGLISEFVASMDAYEMVLYAP
jgi:hypothetical protein